MSIVPSGKARIMEAQSINSPFITPVERNKSSIEKSRNDSASVLDNTKPALETEESMDEDIGGSSEQPLNEENFSSPQKKKTLTTYIFKKLEEWGYPGRRLQEFKSKFVKETVSPEGIKDIQVEIPDKKYPDASGYTDTVENEDLSQISQEVNKMFGLNFNGAERSDGKWTIKFTSMKKADPEEGEITRDNLDEVYGTPSGQKARDSKITNAKTMREMIRESKSILVPKIMHINGE